MYITAFMSITSFGRVNCSLKPVILLSSSTDKKRADKHIKTSAVGYGVDED